jgi:hypothetical protein
MLPLDDLMWKKLKGGYGVPYDASLDLRRLEHGEDVWDRLWEELHHQGDVGEVSYAAVPHLVRIMKQLPHRNWNLYSLASTIEIERHRKTNPPLPEWLEADYSSAWRELLELAVEDLKNTHDFLMVQSIMGAIALAKGHVKLGAMISHLDESELDDILDRYDTWSELYRQTEERTDGR